MGSDSGLRPGTPSDSRFVIVPGFPSPIVVSLTAMTGVTSRVVPVMNASWLVARSAGVSEHSRPGMPSSAASSRTNSRVMPGNRPAASGAVSTAPSRTTKKFDCEHSTSSPAWFCMSASSPPWRSASCIASALLIRLFDLIIGLSACGWLRRTLTSASANALVERPIGRHRKGLDDDDERGRGCRRRVVRQLAHAAGQQDADVRLVVLQRRVRRDRLVAPRPELVVRKRHVERHQRRPTAAAGACADRTETAAGGTCAASRRCPRRRGTRGRTPAPSRGPRRRSSR